MRSKSKCTFSLIKGLYGELEQARRDFEADASTPGGEAYGLWLELLEIADWHFEGAPGLEGDSPDVEGESRDHEPADEVPDGPHASREQLELPGSRGVAPDVPRGTLQRNSEPVPVVGAAPRLTDAEFAAEAARRGIPATRKVR